MSYYSLKIKGGAGGDLGGGGGGLLHRLDGGVEVVGGVLKLLDGVGQQGPQCAGAFFNGGDDGGGILFGLALGGLGRRGGGLGSGRLDHLLLVVVVVALRVALLGIVALVALVAGAALVVAAARVVVVGGWQAVGVVHVVHVHVVGVAVVALAVGGGHLGSMCYSGFSNSAMCTQRC